MSTVDKDDQERSVIETEPPRSEESGWVTARSGASGFRTAITARGFEIAADEPATAGGTNSGPTPYELLLGALAACASMTLTMYARRKSWPLTEVVIRLREARSHAIDCANCDTAPVGIRRIERRIELHGALTDDQRQRLLQIADRCPVKQTLERGLVIESVQSGVSERPEPA